MTKKRTIGSKQKKQNCKKLKEKKTMKKEKLKE